MGSVKFGSELLWIRTRQRRTAYLETRGLQGELQIFGHILHQQMLNQKLSFSKLPLMLEHPGYVSIYSPTKSISSNYWWQVKIFTWWGRMMKSVCSHFKNWVGKADSWFTWLHVRDPTELCSYGCISGCAYTGGFVGFFLLFRSCFFVLIHLWEQCSACLIQSTATCLWPRFVGLCSPQGPHSWAFLGSCPTNAHVPSLQPSECSIPNPFCFVFHGTYSALIRES